MESRIFLIGFMGSGKSTMGAKLARKIYYSYVDMDALIEETAGMTIPGIFSELGEKVFRKWEHDILLELCSRENVVISTGGGAPCHNNMMQIMKDHGATVYLQMSPEALKTRLQRSRTERPLIKGKTDEELLDYIKSKLGDRESYYSQATYTVDGINLEVETLIAILEDR
jgi:shikimate kinase